MSFGTSLNFWLLCSLWLCGLLLLFSSLLLFSLVFFLCSSFFFNFGTSPNWKLRMEYRRDESTSEHKFDPTSTINVRIETIEELSKKVEGKYSGEAAAILD